MLNQELSDVFAQMAEILEFMADPKDIFRIRAYLRASLAIRELSSGMIEKFHKEKRLQEISGIGEGIAKKIDEYIKTGKIKEYESMKKMIPKGYFEMMRIPSLGPRKIKLLNKILGITNKDDLRKAIEEGKVQDLPGFGEKSARKILDGMQIESKNKGRILYGEVYLTVMEILNSLRKCKDIERVEVAGSFRRAEETVGDIDILATGKNSKKIMQFFTNLPYTLNVVAEGGTKTTILTKDLLQVDLRVVKPNQFGSALQYFTGSKQHNVHLRTIAKNRGFKLSEYGFFKGSKLVASETEEDCYRSLGMQYIPPEMRTDSDEIETAYRHELPKPVDLSDIKGDLHVHSKWSDGRDSIEDMALEAIKRGYEYIAITDHSPSLAITKGLKLDMLKKKKKEIDELNAKLPIKILFGTEVDILADGGIDYANDILKMFDIVVASVHSRFGQDNTERIVRAMENPFVHIIGHPSGRLIGQRNAYPLDYEKIFQSARDTGTVLEINSQYTRLDLLDSQIREAKKWGCKFSIDSDAHSVNTLWYLEVGVKWARRGWAQSEDIVNTFTFDELKKALK